MEQQIIILDAKGQQIRKGVLIDRDCIHMYKVGNDYMNCTRESVEALQAEYREKHKKRVRDNKEYMCASTDLFCARLAGFNNPYDEIHNLLKQADQILLAGNGLFIETVRLNAENLKLRKEKIDAQRAKELLCEFICSKGYKEEFERFCIEKTQKLQ